MLFLLTGLVVVMAVVPTASYHFIQNYSNSTDRVANLR